MVLFVLCISGLTIKTITFKVDATVQYLFFYRVHVATAVSSFPEGFPVSISTA